MTRFVLIADTHFGADEMGYQQQKGYPERLPELLKLLDSWIARDGAINFVLHGGDLVDTCSPGLIKGTVEQFRFCVPLYLCLGNHDLDRPDAAALWLEHAPGFLVDGSPHYEIVTEDCLVHVVPNHWNEHDYYWKDVQEARLSAGQLERVSAKAREYAALPQLLCTHAEVFGIPREQTGFDEPYHASHPSFGESVMELVSSNPRIRAVLTGHNHLNSLSHRNGAVVLSAPSFSEVPFEFKLIEVGRDRLTVQTHNVFDAVEFDARYDFDRTYVQGRACDRQCDLRLDGER
jgi:3',5'-cyclic-AMP phosphodiesterase